MGNDLETRAESLPQEAMANMAGDAGAGTEDFGADDVAIPFIKLAQALTPEVRRGADQIEGLEEGEFFNTVTREPLGEVIRVIPVAFEKVYNEWRPREAGGGFVATHATQESALENSEPGNDLEETGNHYVLVETDQGWLQALFPMTSTKLKASRTLNSMVSYRKLANPETGEKFTPPAFAFVYEIEAVEKSNEHGDFFTLQVDSADELTLELEDGPDIYAQAHEFRNLVKSGELDADFGKFDPEEAADEETDEVF